MSSSRAFATIAISTLPVGVDVEIARPDVAPLPFAMSPDEQRGLRSLPPRERGVGFLRLWTGKEAVIKAGGRSVGDGMGAVDVAGLLTADQTTTFDGDRLWTVRLYSMVPGAGDAVIVGLADRSAAEVVMRHIVTPPTRWAAGE